MKSILLLLIGLFVGAASAFSVASVMHERDVYPRAVMDIMQHHLGSLKMQLHQHRCDDAGTDFQRIATFGGEIHNAFKDRIDAGDGDFALRTSTLIKDARTAAQRTSGDCRQLAVSLTQVGEACRACHRRYR